MAKLDRAQVLAYRYSINGLGIRLPAGELSAAAGPGLQDSAPRSGVLSLHARVEDVAVDDWSDQSLIQVWGPRGAIYVISKEDLALFTLGLLPRDPERIKQLQTQARQVLRVLDGRPQRHNSIIDSVASISDVRELLWTATTGWLLPIWDTRTTAVYPAEPAEENLEESRLGLARRFLHHLGPTTTKALQWWTGGTPEDATATMKELAPELTTVEVADEEVLMLTADVDIAAESPSPTGLHLLPPDDVYISRLCGPLLVPDPHAYGQLFPKAPNPGAVIADGEVVATWRRRGRRVTVTPLDGEVIPELVDPVADAATLLPLPDEPADTVVKWNIE